jgi:solute carrier family 27 fatty acid transporter 1/4
LYSQWIFNHIIIFKVEDYSNKVASLFLKKFNLKKGDCVALLMENKPEYPCIWLGLSKIGVVSAFINTNLRSDALISSISIVKSKIIIYSSGLEDGSA